MICGLQCGGQLYRKIAVSSRSRQFDKFKCDKRRVTVQDRHPITLGTATVDLCVDANYLTSHHADSRLG